MPIWWSKSTNQYTVQCSGCGKSSCCMGSDQITTMQETTKAVNILPDGKGHTYCEECLKKELTREKSIKSTLNNVTKEKTGDSRQQLSFIYITKLL